MTVWSNVLPLQSLSMNIQGIAGVVGPLLMGYLISYLLQGVLIVQVFIFCNHPRYSTDRWPIKVTVLSLVFVTIAAWNQLAFGWGHPEVLERPIWAFDYMIFLHALISLCVQLFSCWRITTFRHGRIIVAILVPLSLLQTGMGMYCAIKLWTIGDPAGIYNYIPAITVWLVGSAFCDITIAISMVYLIRQLGRYSEFRATYSLLMRPMMICLETGILTAFISTSHLITLLTVRHDNAHFFFMFLTSKLYSNTVLAALNSRRDRSDTQAHISRRQSFPAHPTNQSYWGAELQMIQPARMSDRMPTDKDEQVSLSDVLAASSRSRRRIHWAVSAIFISPGITRRPAFGSFLIPPMWTTLHFY
ncbi:hypothetical protein NEOLEDRAFT_603409 [Neolentinus lepideus HHB14362 ss-1]|uniref:DUF6534 domain-containing protein n=1 Tax=Neolentinus lepideus HHB14362 ss-1 TaxID=1314782 RepID=A0A165VC80_9AGAM|nr:hypothetical protein NEOLEDRAFT_603409 [Neolentinus lepideus HHB14362 ss-1]